MATKTTPVANLRIEKKTTVHLENGQLDGGLYEEGVPINKTAENVCALTLTGPTSLVYTYANAIRRTLIGEVPYAAFCPTSRVETRFERNSTLFDDEFLRLRVSMVPLSLAPGRAERRRGVFDWTGGRPPIYHASKVGSAGGGGCGFTAGDLVGATAAADGRHANDDLLLLPDPLTRHYPLIAKLREGEELEVTCRPRIDIGRNHTAFSPVGTVGYVVLPPTPGSGEQTIELTVEANNAPGPTAAQHVYDALYWAECHLRDLSSKVNGACDDRASLHSAMTPVAVDVVICGEHDTRGNLVATELRHLFMNPTKDVPSLKFAGYKVPHPLKKEILVRLQPLPEPGAPTGGSKDTALERKQRLEMLRELAKNKLHLAINSSIDRWGSLREQWGGANEILVPTIEDIRE